jgi:glycosyltransferase involved in cell wall biosynthesis
MTEVDPGDFTFRVQTIFRSPPPSLPLEPFAALACLLRLARQPPDILIVSLWRAVALGLLVKLLRPRVRLVLFLHLAVDAHPLDRWINRRAARKAEVVWADSRATLDERMPRLTQGKGRVIPFLSARIDPLPMRRPGPNFIFWGRLHSSKRVDRALEIFARVRARFAKARFTIVGPDRGALPALREKARALCVDEVVEFTGPLDFGAIRQRAAEASFFLHTSDAEGMAVSVVEAMQLGLVPVVTAVGEIAAYAQDGINAVIVRQDAEAVAEVIALLNDERRYGEIRSRAIATWQDKPLYSDSVIEACRELL